VQELIDKVEEKSGTGLMTRIYQMEVDRINFLLKSYHRTRLKKVLFLEAFFVTGLLHQKSNGLFLCCLLKIEQNVIHILSTDLAERLSEEEIEFGTRYASACTLFL
jgi:hypothetical protein